MNKADDYYRQAEEMYKNHADHINSIYYEDSGGELVYNLNDIFELYRKSHKSLAEDNIKLRTSIVEIKKGIEVVLYYWKSMQTEGKNILVDKMVTDLQSLLSKAGKK